MNTHTLSIHTFYHWKDQNKKRLLKKYNIIQTNRKHYAESNKLCI